MTVESGTVSDLASQSLELVNRELSSTLDAARREIESYVDGQSGNDALLRAAGMLHLAAGALKIVEVHGAAMLAEEMEQTCRALPEREDRAAVERGVEALTRAMVQLPAYLDRLLSGGQRRRARSASAAQRSTRGAQPPVAVGGHAARARRRPVRGQA